MSIDACALVHPAAPYVGYRRGGPGGSQYLIIQEFCAAPAVSFQRADGISSPAHIGLVMRSLARFHARWWNAKQEGVLKHYVHPTKLGGPFVRLPKRLTRTAMMMAWKYGLKALVHCYSEEPQYAGVPKFAYEYGEFIEAIRPVVRRRRKAIIKELTYKKPLTLIHGDAHTENIFFGPHFPGGCAFIDFGLISFGQAMPCNRHVTAT